MTQTLTLDACSQSYKSNTIVRKPNVKDTLVICASSQLDTHMKRKLGPSHNIIRHSWIWYYCILLHLWPMDTVAVSTPSHSQFAAGSRGPRQGTACPHRGGNCKSQGHISGWCIIWISPQGRYSSEDSSCHELMLRHWTTSFLLKLVILRVRLFLVGIALWNPSFWTRTTCRRGPPQFHRLLVKFPAARAVDVEICWHAFGAFV